MKIKNIELKHGIMLAPMAGVTDLPFREICRMYGAEYTVSEMISAKAMHYGDKKTAVLAKLSEDEHPAALQIFGSEPDIMAEASFKLVSMIKPDIIDINMGCPVHKVFGNGEGSALMRDSAKVYSIVNEVVQAVNIPVTVKIRSGLDASNINAVEIAAAAESAGAAAICVHGRTRAQMYAPPVNLDIIKEVKNSVSIPVIGNGGIESYQDALNMFEKTGCDAVMIARGACGNPWIFKEIISAIEGSAYYPPTPEERVEAALLHLEKLVAYKGEDQGIREARKHMAWYIKGMDGAAALRGRINSAITLDEMRELLRSISDN